MTPSPYLSIRAIVKRFGKFTALDHIDLDVQKGEFICFLGPSGCGKTTLLRIIAGLEVQDSGQIIQDGQDVSRFPPARRNFGIVFQSYALFPNLTAAENIGYGLRNTGLPKDARRQKVESLLQLIGLPDAGPKYPAQLSGGQQQRIALARALALSPGLLLLDEPLSALDARVRANLRSEISRLHHATNVTTILVTHDQEEALTLADRIVVMDHGHIVQVDTPGGVYSRPNTPFVADFVGQMNFLAAQAQSDGTFRFAGQPLHIARQNLAPIAPGATALLSIRPEDVEVAPELAPADRPSSATQPTPGSVSDNRFSATVERWEFLGPVYRLHLRLSGLDATGSLLVAEIPAGKLHGDEFVNDAVSVILPAARIHIFADHAATQSQMPPNGFPQ